MKQFITLGLLVSPYAFFAQSTQAGPGPKGFMLDTNTLLIIFAVFLLLPIWILSKTFITAARHYYADKLKSSTMKIVVPFGLLLTGNALYAQGTPATSITGMSANAMTILLLGVIAAELMLILFFARKTNDFIQKIPSRGEPIVRESDLMTWIKTQWAAMNFKPIEEEHKIDTGHSYDGIRELDNVIPPWFTTAFLLTIVFAIGYIYRYHIAKSAPMQIEEYENAVALADLRHDEYLRTQANQIDESNVALMTGADMEAGQKIFVTLCAVCHKTDGSGLVGPNLTDNYWIHGGSLQDIFRTVKYGVPDKGMISWKEQLAPVQMAQVSNYILSLVGTNPPDPKGKQGTLYVPDVMVTDSVDIQ